MCFFTLSIPSCHFRSKSLFSFCAPALHLTRCTRLPEWARGGRPLRPSDITNSKRISTLLVLYRDRLSKVSTYISYLAFNRRSSDVIAKDSTNMRSSFLPVVRAKPDIDAAFLKQFRAILFRIAFLHLTLARPSFCGWC